MATAGANDLFGSTSFRVLRRSLDFLAQRQQLTAENIANVDTPNYMAKDLNFQGVIDRLVDPRPPKLASSNPAHFADSSDISLIGSSERHLFRQSNRDDPKSINAGGAAVRVDGNSVEIDREMAKLAETQLAFSVYTRAFAARAASIRVIARDVR
jgi:flagellar basal-body rod protein FlgB